MLRHIPLGRMNNLRDLGGYPGANGRITAWERFLRGDNPLGLEEPDSPEPQEPEGRGGSNVPLVQGALCLLVLGALLLLQYLEAPAYDTFTAWYQQEASQEIQLPAWEEALPQAPTAGPSPSAQPTPSPSPWEGEASLQRI